MLENILQTFGVPDHKYKSRKEYPIFKTPEIQVTGRGTSFVKLNAKSIDNLLSYGGVLINGKEYGSFEHKEKAKQLKKEYQSFSSKEGKELFGDVKYDGYACLDLGPNTYAAHVEVNGKKILAISNQNSDWLGNEVKRLEVFGHETIHNWNKSESGTDKENYDGFVNLYDKAVGYAKQKYAAVVNNIAERLSSVHGYAVPGRY